MDNFENYDVLSVIGSGSFGTCYRVRNKINQKEFVWKAIGYGDMLEENKQLLVSEVNLLSKLKHPNIVRYYDHIIHKQSSTLYIIMEYCSGGDLYRVIKKCLDSDFYIEELFIWRILYQISSALELCHSKCAVTVLHRDIKPENIFIDADKNVKLGDFGLAKILDEKEKFTKTIVGTPLYMSPELVKNRKYNTKSDVWALGCLIYELAALKAPFKASNVDNLKMAIKEGKFDRVPEYYSEELQNMVNFLLHKELEGRPSVNVILRHPTVLTKINQNFKNIVCKKIQLNLDSEVVTKDNLQVRLEIIRNREASLKVKEEKLAERERQIIKREKKLVILERLANEKMLRAELYLKKSKENRAGNYKNKTKAKSNEYLDESFSADPGDTSILPTSTKLVEDQIVKPKEFIRTFSERRVHFNQKKIFENNSDEIVFKEYFFDNHDAVVEKPKKKAFDFNILKTVNSKINHSSQSSLGTLGSKSSNASDNAQNDLSKIWTKENKKCAFSLLRNINNSEANKENINIHAKICHTQL